MIIRPRIIPVLTISNQSLVKTIKFANPNYIGDPINATKIFNEKCVDELCLLDISITRENKKPDFDLLQKISSEAFMPLSYGGGIRSFEDAKIILQMGFEKVIFNTLLIKDRETIHKVIEYAGSQSVVGSIDYKRDLFGKSSCYIECGKRKIKYSPLELAIEAQELGVGEIILNSMDNDGMMNGYDISTIKSISDVLSIPLVALGGANDIKDIKAAIKDGHADAVAAGSMFVYHGKKRAVLINTISEEELIREGIYYEY